MNGKIGNWTILIQRNVKEKKYSKFMYSVPSSFKLNYFLNFYRSRFVQNACVSKIIKTLYLPRIQFQNVLRTFQDIEKQYIKPISSKKYASLS